MIFNEIIYGDRIKLNNFIEAATEENDRYFLLIGIYDEISDILAISNDNIIWENGGNVYTKDIGLKGKKERGILITYAPGTHSGRMKISASGKSVNSNSEYITIYYDNNDIILDKKCKRTLDDIDMNSKEFKTYKDLYLRNKELINLAGNLKDNLDDINDAFRNDEILRNKKHKIVERDKDGNATIYDEKHPDIVEKRINLKGEEI